jgi:hypothetical protein
MNNFDKKCRLLLNEFLGGLASAVGSGLKAAKDPSYAFELAGKRSQEKEKKKGGSYSMDNRPKVGDLAVYVNDTKVVGRIRTKMNNDGQFGIALINPNNQPSEYVFVKTEKKPKENPGRTWRLDFLRQVVANNNSGKDKIVKEQGSQGRMVEQISPSEDYPYIMVGKRTNFENWMSYDSYLKSQK